MEEVRLYNEKNRNDILDFIQGNKGLPILYDGFYKHVFDPERHPERLEDFLSQLFGEPVVIEQVLAKEGNKLVEVYKSFLKTEKEETVEVIDCPKCSGKIVEKKTRRGKIFYGCNNYPKCDFASWDKPLDEKCPDCGNLLVEHGKQIKCISCNYEK